jgi:hypothetical protein
MNTVEKMNANNNLHTELMGMLADASIIFHKTPNMLKHFKFYNILAIIGHGPSGFKGISNGLLPVTETLDLKLTIAETAKRVRPTRTEHFTITFLLALIP